MATKDSHIDFMFLGPIPCPVAVFATEKFVLQHCEHIFVYAGMQNLCRCMQCLHHLN